MIRLRPRTIVRARPDDLLVAALIVVGVIIVGAAIVVSVQPGADGKGGWGWSSPGSSPGGNSATPSPSSADARFLLAQARPAPPIDLIEPNSAPFSLSSLLGHDVLVFFGYTHCPDVCPATIGVVGQVLAARGSGTRAVFVTVDPERDTPAWLQEYSQYLPQGFTALTGTADRIRTTAGEWGIRYAKVDTGSPGAYSMMHTADVYLVDAAGIIRADFPFGTGRDDMVRTIEAVDAATPTAPPSTSVAPQPAVSASPAVSAPPATARPPSAQPSATPSDGPSAPGQIQVDVVSTSIWAGESPVILALSHDGRRMDDPSLAVHVSVGSPDGTDAGSSADAVAVRPPGIADVSYLVTLHFPSPGQWQLLVTAANGASTNSGTALVTALEPGGTAAIGAPAPTVHTPTLDDVGGDARAVTTDPQPDLRLSMHSTTDALASHQPFVLVIDSPKFRVSPVCGKAVIMARYLADRWPAVDFIHLEPFVYTLVSETPVLSGDLADPPVAPAAQAWGISQAPWSGLSMPWVFVVDGNGIVRAKYQGLMGSDDVDVLLAALGGAA